MRNNKSDIFYIQLSVSKSADAWKCTQNYYQSHVSTCKWFNEFRPLCTTSGVKGRSSAMDKRFVSNGCLQRPPL